MYAAQSGQGNSDSVNENDGADSWASSDDEGGEGAGAQPNPSRHTSDRHVSAQKGASADAEYLVDEHDTEAPVAEEPVPEDYYKDVRSTTAAPSATDDAPQEYIPVHEQGELDGDDNSNVADNMVDAADDPRFSALGREDDEAEKVRRRHPLNPLAAGLYT